MKRPPFRNPWDSEAEIAAAIREALETCGWRVYPETGGYDMLAFRGVLSMGVETKLDAGTAAGYASLLRQILPGPAGSSWDWWKPPTGPHRLLVAAPRFASEVPLRRLGIDVVVTAECRESYSSPLWRPEWGPWRRCAANDLRSAVDWITTPRFRPVAPPTEPELLIDVPAGVPSPSTSGPWKVAAVKLMLRMRAGEPLTSRDFDDAGVAVSSFRHRGWIRDSGRRFGKLYIWEAADGHPADPAPDLRWPEIVAALKAKTTAPPTSGAPGADAP